MRTREEVVAKANELAKAGRVNEAKALLDAWKARQGGSPTPEPNAAPAASQAVSGPYDAPYQPSPDEPVRFDPRELLDPLKQFRRGMTLGFWQDPEGEARMQAAGRGGLVTGANVLGAVATGGPIGAVGRNLVTRGLVGAGEGGLTAAGYGDDVGAGAGFGAALNTAFPLLGRGFDAVANVFGRGDRAAGRAVQQTLDQAGLNPDQAQAAIQRLDGDAWLADISPTAQQRLNQAQTYSPYEGQQAVAARARSRENMRGERLESALDEALTSRNASQADAASRAAREKQAAPLYRQAFDTEVTLTPEDGRWISAMNKRPSMKKAVRAGAKLAADEGKDWKKMTLGEQMHYAKMGLDDLISTSKKPQARRAMVDQKNELLDWMDTHLDGYGEARAIYSDSFTLQRARDAGRQVFKGQFDKDEIDALTKGMTPAELEEFRVGARHAISNALEVSGGVLTKKQRAVLNRLFPQEVGDASDLIPLRNQMAAEQTMMGSEAAISNAGAAAGTPMISSRTYLGATLNSPAIMATGAAESVIARLKRLPGPDQAKVAEILSRPNLTADDMREVMSYLEAFERRARPAAGATTAGALALEENE